jgi:hypothetical protein
VTHSRWNETHTRGDVPHHAWRINRATEPVTEDEPIPGELPQLDQMRWARWVAAEAQQLVEASVVEARRHRITWAEIGEVHGMTRQAAHQRFGHLDR